VVRPGEKVPIDGVVVEGTSTLNTSALTGESVPREITVDQDVISGCVNLTRTIKDPYYQGIRRIHGIQDPGSGRELQHEEVQI